VDPASGDARSSLYVVGTSSKPCLPLRKFLPIKKNFQFPGRCLHSLKDNSASNALPALKSFGASVLFFRLSPFQKSLSLTIFFAGSPTTIFSMREVHGQRKKISTSLPFRFPVSLLLKDILVKHNSALTPSLP
jgi:hypothetical protein